MYRRLNFLSESFLSEDKRNEPLRLLVIHLPFLSKSPLQHCFLIPNPDRHCIASNDHHSPSSNRQCRSKSLAGNNAFGQPATRHTILSLEQREVSKPNDDIGRIAWVLNPAIKSRSDQFPRRSKMEREIWPKLMEAHQPNGRSDQNQEETHNGVRTPREKLRV